MEPKYDKGDIVETELDGESAWVTLTGYHGKDAFQARISTPLDGESFTLGQYIKLERDRILRKLPPDDERE